jgi:precorrin-2 dehydrogenase/sirohydrochlorin ferrochelatase
MTKRRRLRTSRASEGGDDSTPMPHAYPMMVHLAGRRCLVVGGGRVAERKVRLLLDCGATVRVVSPVVSATLDALAESGEIRLSRRRVRPADIAGAFLVFATTDDPAVNARVAALARKAGGLVNVADDPAACTFQVPASFRRGDLTVAVSTGGGSPALAKRLRQRLEATVGPEYEAFLAALRELRERARQRIADPLARQAIYRRAVESDLFECAIRGDRAAVRARIAALVDAGPGTPES